MKVAPEDVIRIEMLTKPEADSKDEGSFEWRHLKSTVMMDILQLKNEVELVAPGRSEDITDRIYNFHKVYINTKTGEVST